MSRLLGLAVLLGVIALINSRSLPDFAWLMTQGAVLSVILSVAVGEMKRK